MTQILSTLDELWREAPERIQESAQNAVAILREIGSSVTLLSMLTDDIPARAHKQFAANGPLSPASKLHGATDEELEIGGPG